MEAKCHVSCFIMLRSCRGYGNEGGKAEAYAKAGFVEDSPYRKRVLPANFSDTLHKPKAMTCELLVGSSSISNGKQKWGRSCPSVSKTPPQLLVASSQQPPNQQQVETTRNIEEATAVHTFNMPNRTQLSLGVAMICRPGQPIQ